MILPRKARVNILGSLAWLLVLSLAGSVAMGDGETAPARDPRQPVDEAYTAKIQQYTTEPYFTSPLVNYLPASKSVPTPLAVLGDVAGAPGILPYAEEVYKYMRLLEEASPRVRVFSFSPAQHLLTSLSVARRLGSGKGAPSTNNFVALFLICSIVPRKSWDSSCSDGSRSPSVAAIALAQSSRIRSSILRCGGDIQAAV